MKWHSWEVARIGRLTVVALVLLGLLFGVVPASATSIWTSGEFTFGDDEETDPHYQDTICKEKTVSVIGVRSTPQTAQLCVYERPGWRYARYYRAQFEDYFVISIGGDSFMYNVDGLAGGAPFVEVPNSSDLIFNTTRSGANNHNLYVIKDFPAQLTLAYDGPGLSKRYHVNGDNYEPLILDWEGREITVGSVGVSRNGDWLVLEDKATGFLFVNPKTYALKWFSNYKHAYVPGNTAKIKFVISGDGQFVAAFDPKIQPIIYTVGADCAIESNSYSEAFVTQVQTAQPCPDDGQRMYNALLERFPYATAQSMFAYHFNDKGDVLYFLRATYEENPDGSVTTTYYHLPLQSNGYIPQPEIRLDYLALGDSYSSGEGDTERDKYGNKHYRTYTDVEEDSAESQPREKCHISTRSYPYKLAQGMGLTLDVTKRWDTIACSGAQSYDVNGKNSSSYLGQGKGGSEGGKPRLQGYSNAQELKVTALNEFIPGRQKQIEFVEKYKPKVITLTMGGNDVGFGTKIYKCANPFTLEQTCDHAINEGRPKLKKEINDEYDTLKPLYEQLFKASGQQAKIYVLGYPKFINGGEDGETEEVKCGGNIGALNNDERLMIAEATEYMNNVIEQAAKAAGVKYIDVEDSLTAGRLCDEGQEYMTGVVGAPLEIRNQQQESFHPNANGHSQIAIAVWDAVNSESLLDYDICPETTQNICPDGSATKNTIPTPAYFASDPEPQQKVVHKEMTWGDLVKDTLTRIIFAPYSFQPGSLVQIQLHSDPTDLGTFTIPSDGSLDVASVVPSTIPAGYHTLTVTGQTYSGEVIEFEQTVLVKGSDPDDIDENGVPDGQQVCGPFLVASGQDTDLDGIDDACDPYIDPTPRSVYRLRAGDSVRSYQGSAEHTDYLYLERNIYATSLTGVSGDDDPDGDGYTVIAASQGPVPSGRYASLQINTTTIPNTVYLGFRTAENGCVQYKPTDLSQVTSGSSYRTFTQHATDTATCRSQAASDDLDGNGQPDNTQPLYIGHNGDPAKGEAATKLYLLRSTRGAEAQLGITDYAPLVSTAPNSIPVDDPTDYREPWSLLASTQSNPILAVTYRGIHMVGDIPYVVAKTNIGGLCQAYKPASISTIHMSTQANTNLTLDLQQTLLAQLQGWCE